jgi:outer membrane protein
MKRAVFHLCVACAVLALADSALSAERLEMTLSEAIEVSLRENLSIAEEDVLLKMAHAQRKTSEGEFDPALSLDVSEAFQKTQVPTILVSPEQRLLNYGISLGGKLKTGTAYELQWSGSKTTLGQFPFLILNPYYTNQFTLSLTQPVLKGRGSSVQESNINVAEKSVEIAELQTGLTASAVIADTARAYWDLYFTRYDAEVAGLSLELARNLLEEVLARIESGSMAPVEIYKAEAEVAQREENLLRARKAVSDAEDALKGVMNFQQWETELVPVEVPAGPGAMPALDTVLKTAFENRRDYKQALRDLESKEILRRFYGNQLLPELDFTASAGLNGTEGGFGDSFDSSTSGDYYSWQLGLSLTIPINNRTARGNFLKSKYDEEKAALRIRGLRQSITLQAREAVRSLRLAKESVAATLKTRVASEKRLLAERARFGLGLATLNDVLTFQKEYAAALSSEKRALTDYWKAWAELGKATGTLLQGLGAGGQWGPEKRQKNE